MLGTAGHGCACREQPVSQSVNLIWMQENAVAEDVAEEVVVACKGERPPMSDTVGVKSLTLQ